MMTSGKMVTSSPIAARRIALGIVVGAVALLTVTTALASSDAHVNAKLTPSVDTSNARGKAKLKLKSGKRGKFTVSAGRLAPDHTFDVVVGGVKVGSFQTNGGGRGRLRFSTKPHGAESMLGFDPRGMSVSVRDVEGGDDDLGTDIPDDAPGDGACCLTNDDGETECDDIDADACVSAGGTVADSASCLPDPCATTPPSGATVCCTNETHDEESESECEHEVSDADCAAAGGLVVEATSCDPNPCQATPPPDVVACCIAHSGGGGDDEGDDDGDDDGDHHGDDHHRDDHHGGEHHHGEACAPSGAACRLKTADACTAAGGTPTVATSCTPDLCNAGSPSGAFLDVSPGF